jgi:nicotinamidase-related amidase
MAAISRLEPTLGAHHTGLILFDVMVGYLHPTDPEGQAFFKKNDVLARLVTLYEAAHRAGMTVFYPIGQHAADGSDTVARLTDSDMSLQPLQGKSITPKLHKGMGKAGIAPELRPGPGDVIIPKHRWNAFFSTDLEFHLRVRGIDTVILAGGWTDIGIASTAFAARDLDLGLVLPRDACFSLCGSNHDLLMDRLFPRMGRIMSTEQTVRLLEDGTPTLTKTSKA